MITRRNLDKKHFHHPLLAQLERILDTIQAHQERKRLQEYSTRAESTLLYTPRQTKLFLHDKGPAATVKRAPALPTSPPRGVLMIPESLQAKKRLKEELSICKSN
jgi:hypothetical protein